MNYKKLLENRNAIPEAFDGHKLQLIIGLLAISFPFALILSYAVLGDENCSSILSAISAYYHTNVGTYFTGVLFAIAMAMFAYQGRSRLGGHLATFAAIMAIFVAIFPTTIDYDMSKALGNYCITNHLEPPRDDFGIIHYISAVLLFIALIVFAFLFKKATPKSNKVGKRKRLVFTICIVGMILSMLFMALYSFELGMKKQWFIDKAIPVIIIGESICLILFGISWLVEYTTVSGVKKRQR